MAALALTGAFDNVSMVIRQVITQMSTPNEMRGRVSAVSSIFIGSSNELGGFESGLVAELTTPIISVVAGAIGTLVVVGSRCGLFSRLLALGSLSSLTPERLASKAKSVERGRPLAQLHPGLNLTRLQFITTF